MKNQPRQLQPGRGPGLDPVAVGGGKTQLPQAGILQLHVVIIVEIVDADDRMPLGHEPAGEVEADEAGDAGHEHGRLFSRGLVGLGCHGSWLPWRSTALLDYSISGAKKKAACLWQRPDLLELAALVL